ncbi:hypothetical protein LPC08_07390 [Roseomonas sp. OT10]|uniref:hypothetical protein n=1 Tax=Roseomonas cutis TaxID=2897332 RepID=UPI001E60C36B|nr:hypothetical protein [Roseomonas sp. OT10]UFN50432.1 hypothetical protein LPC08_07390 [Roseomonas sp. OT10]
MAETPQPASEPEPSRSGGPEGYIPRPPSPEALKEIGRQQALITDEWSGEPEAEATAPAPPSGRGDPG